jgi:hypothetical protein
MRWNQIRTVLLKKHKGFAATSSPKRGTGTFEFPSEDHAERAALDLEAQADQPGLEISRVGNRVFVDTEV